VTDGQHIDMYMPAFYMPRSELHYHYTSSRNRTHIRRARSGPRMGTYSKNYTLCSSILCVLPCGGAPAAPKTSKMPSAGSSSPHQNHHAVDKSNYGGQRPRDTGLHKGIYNARCLGKMLRLINWFLVKYWCLYRLDRCLTKHLFYINKHQCLAKCLVYFSKHPL
jgi:hypothetical protein